MFSTMRALSLLALALPSLVAAGISVSLTGEAVVTNVDNLKVDVHIKNTGTGKLKILNDPRGLHRSNWLTRAFDIKSDAGVVPIFKGVRAKFSKASAIASKSYTTLDPGSTHTYTHQLGGVYDVSASGVGKYTISVSKAAQEFSVLNDKGTIDYVHAEIVEIYHVELKGNVQPKAYVGPSVNTTSVDKRAPAVNTFIGCSATQQAALKKAAVNAQNLANNAISALQGTSSGKPRFTTWFGTFDVVRKIAVLFDYVLIGNGQLSSDTFDCSTCTKPSRIYLCSVFWTAPDLGTDSKAGTLVHESSHFYINGGTDDVVYGQSGCKSLAQSDPFGAARNADTHEYYAENTPFLS